MDDDIGVAQIVSMLLLVGMSVAYLMNTRTRRGAGDSNALFETVVKLIEGRDVSRVVRAKSDAHFASVFGAEFCFVFKMLLTTASENSSSCSRMRCSSLS